MCFQVYLLDIVETSAPTHDVDATTDVALHIFVYVLRIEIYITNTTAGKHQKSVQGEVASRKVVGLETFVSPL
jgi:hypothetical protein